MDLTPGKVNIVSKCSTEVKDALLQFIGLLYVGHLGTADFGFSVSLTYFLLACVPVKQLQFSVLKNFEATLR